MGPLEQLGEPSGMNRVDAIALGLIDRIHRGHRNQIPHSPELKESVLFA